MSKAEAQCTKLGSIMFSQGAWKEEEGHLPNYSSAHFHFCETLILWFKVCHLTKPWHENINHRDMNCEISFETASVSSLKSASFVWRRHCCDARVMLVSPLCVTAGFLESDGAAAAVINRNTHGYSQTTRLQVAEKGKRGRAGGRWLLTAVLRSRPVSGHCPFYFHALSQTQQHIEAEMSQAQRPPPPPDRATQPVHPHIQ